MSTATATLHLFTDGTDTYVASDLEHLATLYQETVGSHPSEVWDDDWRDEWRQKDDDEPTGIYWSRDYDRDVTTMPSATIRETAEDERQFEEWSIHVTAPASEWAGMHGAGFLCSTEW